VGDHVIWTDERLEYLGQIAAWYYEDGLDQSAIAERIGRSRSMVSRLLSEARDAGVVETRVRFPLRTDDELADEIRQRFGLSEVRVLAGADLDDEAMLRRLGRLASRLLQAHLRSEIDVVVGWGATLHQVVRALPEIRLRDVMVLQSMGAVGDGDPEVDGPELARALASKLNGDFRSLSAPVLVDKPETARSLLSERSIATVLRQAAAADVLLTGIGSIDAELSGLLRAGYLSDSDIERLRSNGVVGDMMGFFLDASGRIADVPENDRIVSLPPDRCAGFTIAVAGGAAKAPVITSALRGGFLDALVTDTTAARSVLEMGATPRTNLMGVS
jgi:DNA-binding transcriptional regulator LsrR (DeoR family)